MQISRSEQKRRIQDVERLVGDLLALPPRILGQAPCEEEIRQHLLEACRLKGSVRQRQVKYLTKLLLRENLTEVMYAFASRHSGRDLAAKSRLRSLEQWRNALIDEALVQEAAWREDETVDWGEVWPSRIAQEISQKLPRLDLRALSRLAYRFVQTRDPRYSRELFRVLRSAQDVQERDNRRREATFTPDEPSADNQDT